MPLTKQWSEYRLHNGAAQRSAYLGCRVKRHIRTDGAWRIGQRLGNRSDVAGDCVTPPGAACVTIASLRTANRRAQARTFGVVRGHARLFARVAGWGRQDSNLRRQSQLVYSQSPLTTRALPRRRSAILIAGGRRPSPGDFPVHLTGKSPGQLRSGILAPCPATGSTRASPRPLERPACVGPAS